MPKRRWLVVLALVGALSLLTAGTAYAAQAGNGPQAGTGSTVTPSTLRTQIQDCTTCTPSTLRTQAQDGACATCTPSTLRTRDRDQVQTQTCDQEACGQVQSQSQTRQRLQDATCNGTGDGNRTANRAYGNRNGK